MTFFLSAWGRQLTDSFPDPSKWRDPQKISRDDLLRFIRLWLVEGIPYAFRAQPMLYEHLREHVALQIQESSRQITIIGSGRLGFSLAPPPKFGRPYSDQSDLDMLIVSERWLNALHAEFDNWRNLYQTGKMTPRKPEEKYWQENVTVVARTLARGFIDTNKLPNRAEFPAVVKFSQLRYLVGRRLKSSDPGLGKLTFRIYKSWDAAVRQNLTNLQSALPKAVA